MRKILRPAAGHDQRVRLRRDVTQPGYLGVLRGQERIPAPLPLGGRHGASASACTGVIVPMTESSSACRVTWPVNPAAWRLAVMAGCRVPGTGPEAAIRSA